VIGAVVLAPKVRVKLPPPAPPPTVTVCFSLVSPTPGVAEPSAIVWTEALPVSEGVPGRTTTCG
jgi:hypothetical protein